MRKLVWLPMLLMLSAGCLTASVKTGINRGTKFAREKAKDGDKLAEGVANEMEMVSKATGADKIEGVELSAEAANENAGVIKQELETKGFLMGLLDGALNILSNNVPGFGAALSALGVAVALGKKLLSKGKALTAAMTLINKGKEVVASDAKLLDKVKAVYVAARTDGPAFVAGSKELYAEYTKFKTGTAK